MNVFLSSLRSVSRILPLAAAALSVAVFPPATAGAFDIIAKLERDFSTQGGPSEYACTFCPNTSTQVRAQFSGGFPPPANPVALPANSQILGIAFGDLRTGGMHGKAFAASYGHNEQHQMRFVSSLRETIDIDVPPGTPAAQRFATFIGHLSASAVATNRASAKGIYVLSAHSLRAAVSWHHLDGWDVIDGESNAAIESTSITNGTLVTGHYFVLRSPIPTGGVMVIETQLEGTAWAEARHTTSVGIANVDGPATATLRMILPQGATYTSTSGVFLTGSAMEAWRQQYFDTSENSGPGADDADPDGDGIVNQMEFATLTNPLISTPSPITLVLAGGNLDFTYPRNKAALGELTFAVEAGETLDAGSWSTAGITESILSDDGPVQQIKATIPAGGKRLFARLSVAIAPP
jgi:hypothetical protein